MAHVTVQARISPELKEEVDAILFAIGLSTAEAIRLFLQQTVNSGGLPFQPTAKHANADMLDSMLELENGGGMVFESTEDLFTDWKSQLAPLEIRQSTRFRREIKWLARQGVNLADMEGVVSILAAQEPLDVKSR